MEVLFEVATTGHRRPTDFPSPKPRKTQRVREGISLVNAESISGFSRRRKQWTSRPCWPTYLDCSAKQVISARRAGRLKISNDHVAGLHDRLAMGTLKEVRAWMVDI